jgi:tetratricopeptide (TPR) repeat protein
MHKPAKALELFKSAHSIRQDILSPDDSFITWGFNNLALAYTELGELDNAEANNAKSLQIRLRTDSERIGNSYSNISSLLLRMGKPDEAEETLKKCPSLQAFTIETFLATKNPRFASDMVLLSRIRRHQNRYDEALQLASKALAFRRKLLGNRFKVCDSLYDVAGLLQRLGNTASAVYVAAFKQPAQGDISTQSHTDLTHRQMLEEAVAICESLPEGEGHLARANYKLSVLCSETGRFAECEAHKRRAMELRLKVRPEEGIVPFAEEEYMKLCPWMLW